MKFNSAKVRNIIRLQRDFTDIDGIDKYGRFVYDVKYWVNIPRAIKNDSILVKISVYDSNPIINSNIFENVHTAEEVITRLKSYDTSLKNKVNAARATPLAVKYSDISKNINNEIAKKIKRDPASADKYLGMQRQIIAIPTPTLSEKNPASLANLSISKIEEPTPNDKSIRRAALKSILSDGTDPSAVGEASFPINTLFASMQGVNRKLSSNRRLSGFRPRRKLKGWSHGNHRAMLQSHGNSRIKASPWGRHIRKTLRQRSYKRAPNISLMPSKTQVTTRLVSKRWAVITEEVRISSQAIQGLQKLHFLIELYDTNGNILDIKHRVVDHDAELEEFLTPDYPPHIKARPLSIGRNVIYLRQTDKVATEVWLYRKYLNPASSNFAKKYELIRKIRLTRKDRGRRVLDWVNNSSTCVYRAIPIGPRKRVSHAFRNAVARPFRHKSLGKISPEELTHVSIFAQTQGDKVVVRVSNIPEGPVALYVEADNLSSRPAARRFNDSLRIVGSVPEHQVQIVNSDTSDLIFDDPAVQHGHIYEYRCVLIYPNGNEVRSKVTEIHEFFKEVAEEERVVVQLTGLAIQADDIGNASVSFNIEPSFTDTGMETIVGALKAAGTDSSFIDELYADREKLNDLVAFLIQRQDSTSGETETFGVLSSGEFVDDITTRKYTGVSPLEAGRSYRYIVRVLTRSAETLFDTALGSNIDAATAKRYENKISKFMNPSTLRNGTLPSTGQSFGTNPRSKLKSQDKFIEGRTGIEAAIEADIPEFKPEINKLSAKKVSTNKTMLYWTISGDQDDIDHFIIMARFQGIKSTVGTTHNISYGGQYYFIDKELSGEPGTIEYSVTPVLSDYTYGTEVNAKDIMNETAEPSFIVGT
jgi:hypothetical protein